MRWLNYFNQRLYSRRRLLSLECVRRWVAGQQRGLLQRGAVTANISRTLAPFQEGNKQKHFLVGYSSEIEKLNHRTIYLSHIKVNSRVKKP